MTAKVMVKEAEREGREKRAGYERRGVLDTKSTC